jgi:hypothetical protein
MLPQLLKQKEMGDYGYLEGRGRRNKQKKRKKYFLLHTKLPSSSAYTIMHS